MVKTLDTKLAAIMRDITNCSGGSSKLDKIMATIEKAAKKGKSFIIEKYYDNGHSLERYASDYSYWLSRVENNDEPYMQKFYKDQLEQVENNLSEEHIELIKQGFKFSVDEFCIPFFGKSYHKVRISW